MALPVYIDRSNAQLLIGWRAEHSGPYLYVDGGSNRHWFAIATQGGYYSHGIDGESFSVYAYQSDDEGETWTAGASFSVGPQFSTPFGVGWCILSGDRFANKIYISYTDTAYNNTYNTFDQPILIRSFDMTTGTWSSASSPGPLICDSGTLNGRTVSNFPIMTGADAGWVAYQSDTLPASGGVPHQKACVIPYSSGAFGSEIVLYDNGISTVSALTDGCYPTSASVDSSGNLHVVVQRQVYDGGISSYVGQIDHYRVTPLGVVTGPNPIDSGVQYTGSLTPGNLEVILDGSNVERLALSYFRDYSVPYLALSDGISGAPSFTTINLDPGSTTSPWDTYIQLIRLPDGIATFWAIGGVFSINLIMRKRLWDGTIEADVVVEVPDGTYSNSAGNGFVVSRATGYYGIMMAGTDSISLGFTGGVVHPVQFDFKTVDESEIIISRLHSYTDGSVPSNIGSFAY